eukprot:Tbor_TRINITY_DN5410_c1_g1::TRINITY_DN5410_c1_g1_i2::g.25373::m.25373
MLRVFSGNCLSLEDTSDLYIKPSLPIQRPHLLGSGVDYFTVDGEPLRPVLCAHTLSKVFSGSTLDLNALAEGNSNNNSPDGNNGGLLIPPSLPFENNGSGNNNNFNINNNNNFNNNNGSFGISFNKNGEKMMMV